jgi:hypothetical protein
MPVFGKSDAETKAASGCAEFVPPAQPDATALQLRREIVLEMFLI